MWKFKSLKGKDKWIFLLTIGVILCILAFPAEKLTGRSRETGLSLAGKSGDTAVGLGDGQGQEIPVGEVSAVAVSARAEDSYEAQLEQRIKEILKHVDGVGSVDVMVVLKSSSEKVIHVDENTSYSTTEETDSSGGSRKIESQDRDSSTVMSSQNGQNMPIIEKEIFPELSGIIISASGGDNPTVQTEISAAMEALFGLPAHKIKVLKRVE